MKLSTNITKLLSYVVSTTLKTWHKWLGHAITHLVKKTFRNLIVTRMNLIITKVYILKQTTVKNLQVLHYIFSQMYMIYFLLKGIQRIDTSSPSWIVTLIMFKCCYSKQLKFLSSILFNFSYHLTSVLNLLSNLATVFSCIS